MSAEQIKANQSSSPLDAATKAEIELSEDHERWLEWMVEHQIQHIRLTSDLP